MMLTKTDLAHVHRQAAEMEAKAYFMSFRARDMRNQAADHRAFVSALRARTASRRASSPVAPG